jgi:anti-sigma regulatory factor (Ser/Thr protein kinase)
MYGATDEAMQTGSAMTMAGLESRRVSVPSTVMTVASVRAELAAWLADSGVRQAVIDDAVVIISELVTNAVRHSGALPNASIRVEWQLKPGWLRLQVADDGQLVRPRDLHAQGPVGGRGLAIVSALADSWWLERDGQGTTVTAIVAVS